MAPRILDGMEQQDMDESAMEGTWRPAALALVAELDRRGLVAQVMGGGLVRVRNPAAKPDPDEPLGRVMGPELRQDVVCRRREGEWWWLWAWSGPTRQSPPELEPLCPVDEAATAADRLARVLHVPFIG